MRPDPAGHLAVQLRDGVRMFGEAEGERRQAESGHPVEAPEREHLLGRDAERLGGPADVAPDQLLGEYLVAGGNRRVGREHRRAANTLDGVLSENPFPHQRADALEREERRMPLVHVEHGGPKAQRSERTYAADPEQELLPDAVLAVAAVESVREPVDLEQVQRHGAHVLAPDRGGEHLPLEVDLDRDRLADEACRLRVDRLVVLRLSAGRVDALLEIAAAIEQADADDRDAELGRRLQVVAREDAEPARVDRQGRLDSELHAEVGDEQVGLAAVGSLPPGPRLGRGLHRCTGS